MARFLGWLAHLGHITDEELGGGGTPTNGLISEASVQLVSEDGTTFLVQE